MRSFLKRSISLIILIGSAIAYQYFHSESLTSVFYFFSAVLCCYFFIPLMKNPLINYLLLLLLFPIAAFSSIQLYTILPLYAFFAIESCFHLKGRAYY